MSGFHITEDQVEKAARALAYNMTNGLVTEVEDQDRDVARAVLVAVGPMIAAQAQREAAEGMREYIGRDASTPYTQGWNRALEVVSGEIEKAAGR